MDRSSYCPLIAQFYWRAIYNKTRALQRKLDSEPVQVFFYLYDHRQEHFNIFLCFCSHSSVVSVEKQIIKIVASSHSGWQRGSCVIMLW